MKLPAEFEFGDAWKRSDRERDLVIDSYISLRPGVPRIEVEVQIDNEINDHRLRVLLPSGATQARTYFADSVYDVIERPIALRENNHLYREQEVETKPQQTWTAVTASHRGLAVISGGLL